MNRGPRVFGTRGEHLFEHRARVLPGQIYLSLRDRLCPITSKKPRTDSADASRMNLPGSRIGDGRDWAWTEGMKTTASPRASANLSFFIILPKKEGQFVGHTSGDCISMKTSRCFPALWGPHQKNLAVKWQASWLRLLGAA